MVDDAVARNQIRALLDAVRERPDELPLAEVVELSQGSMRVSVDREGEEPFAVLTPRPDPRFDALTPREREVATLVAAGFTNRQIAEALFISVATVKDHVHSTLRKTGLTSRSEVAACWYGRL